MVNNKMKKSKEKSDFIPEKQKKFSFENAINLTKDGRRGNFRETIEASIHVITNPKKARISIKGYSLLPHTVGKHYKIAVFITKNEYLVFDRDNVIMLDEDNLEDVINNKIKFNMLLTTPMSITKIGKMNKILSAKKLMPDIKYGTITTNMQETLNNFRKNYIRFKSEKNNIIHCAIGKIDLENIKLKENMETIISDIKKQKPKNCKSIIIEKINISSTMGVGLNLNINSLSI